jgi:GTP1/Obg family GTP-binding protein
MLEMKHVLYHFPVTENMEKYYRELIRITDKQLVDDKIKESLFEMKQYEDQYEKLLQMVRPKRSDLN